MGKHKCPSQARRGQTEKKQWLWGGNREGKRRCAWCGEEFTFDKMSVDHHPPLSSGNKSLVVLACIGCNTARAVVNGHICNLKQLYTKKSVNRYLKKYGRLFFYPLERLKIYESI